MTSLISGTLSDNEIKAYCLSGRLIAENYLEDNIKQACYELRASTIYYDLSDGKRKYVLNDGEYILIKPKQLIVVVTLESLILPLDILGRILTKGRLFSIGLLPVNTYADPGFDGRLGIVLYNLSTKYLKINPGESIAKIEFSKLQFEVSRPYHGQHGYHTSIWPIPEEMVLSVEELKGDSRIKSTEEEIILSYGNDVGSVIKRVFSFERHLIYATVIYLVFSILLIGTLVIRGTNVEAVMSPLVNVVLGVVSNIIFGLITYYFLDNLRGR